MLVVRLFILFIPRPFNGTACFSVCISRHILIIHKISCRTEKNGSRRCASDRQASIFTFYFSIRFHTHHNHRMKCSWNTFMLCSVTFHYKIVSFALYLRSQRTSISQIHIQFLITFICRHFYNHDVIRKRRKYPTGIFHTITPKMY